MKKILLLLVFALSSGMGYAQYGYRDSNRIGITVGTNQFTLNTFNFNSKAGLGWNAGLSVRGNFYNKWDMVYALQFSENNFSVETNKPISGKEDVNYKLPSAQICLQVCCVIIENHLSFEVGPLIQVNGKLNLDNDKGNNKISGTTLLAKDIVDISKFNLYPVVGLTAGVRHFRINVSYQYGINNILDNLNNKSLGYNFKGNPGILNGNIILYL